MRKTDTFFTRNMILFLEAKEKETALRTLANHLIKFDYVKPSYVKGILAREQVYPTGLFTGWVNVAVPHTDCEHVIKDGIALGILSEPVVFQAMDEPTKEIPVRLIVRLALKESHGQLAMLQAVIAMVKDQTTLKKLLRIHDQSEAYGILETFLVKGAKTK